MPKRMTPGIFQEESSCAAARASSGDRRKTPGSEEISSLSPFPFRTKSGARKRSAVRRVSRTRARRAGVRRRRRRRVVGKDLTVRLYGFETECSRSEERSEWERGRNERERGAGGGGYEISPSRTR